MLFNFVSLYCHRQKIFTFLLLLLFFILSIDSVSCEYSVEYSDDNNKGLLEDNENHVRLKKRDNFSESSTLDQPNGLSLREKFENLSPTLLLVLYFLLLA